MTTMILIVMIDRVPNFSGVEAVINSIQVSVDDSELVSVCLMPAGTL